jgi:hypothetical protein
MMDRQHLDTVAGLTAEQREEAMIEAATSAARTPDASLKPILEALRDKDPDIKVREAAQRALTTP